MALLFLDLADAMRERLNNRETAASQRIQPGDIPDIIEDEMLEALAKDPELAKLLNQHGEHSAPRKGASKNTAMPAAEELSARLKLPAVPKIRSRRTKGVLDLHTHEANELLTQGQSDKARSYLCRALEEFLRLSRDQGLRKVKIIHGIGSGSLRQLTHSILESELYRQVDEFTLEPLTKGGVNRGTSIVTLRRE
jgi:DNA-nicking Smr family endonuclease